ncbi:hypothetical protein PUN28_000029 [Cardiocondyla obscurior]|uniref:Uncharacterized protein n=1 Tax=Cardiocondyla obscurior TaxID=286306 RepID=A0AAW2GXI3_9HYME
MSLYGPSISSSYSFSNSSSFGISNLTFSVLNFFEASSNSAFTSSTSSPMSSSLRSSISFSISLSLICFTDETVAGDISFATNDLSIVSSAFLISSNLSHPSSFSLLIYQYLSRTYPPLYQRN